MTAVMRAMSVATGPKVLRIGLVQSGRVVEERIIKQRTTVTVGSNERAVFVIPSQAVPPMFKLFELVGNDYHLNFLDGMTGRVALASGITDLGALKAQAKKALDALNELIPLFEDGMNDPTKMAKAATVMSTFQQELAAIGTICGG